MDATLRHAAESAIGHVFADPSLLGRALTHASMAEQRLHSNERLEFLGDAVLGLVVCDLVYRQYPHLLEGEMTKIKSLAVSRQTCAEIAQRLGLERLLILGKGMQGPGPIPSSLAAAALEALVGAVFLDAGFEAAQRVIRPLVIGVVEQAARSGHQHNFKSVLQQHAQQTINQTPCYRILDEQGPDHAKAFKIAVEIGARRFEPCWGQSKKKAEQEAALMALRELGLVQDGPGGELRMVENGVGVVSSPVQPVPRD